MIYLSFFKSTDCRLHVQRLKCREGPENSIGCQLSRGRGENASRVQGETKGTRRGADGGKPCDAVDDEMKWAMGKLFPAWLKARRFRRGREREKEKDVRGLGPKGAGSTG